MSYIIDVLLHLIFEDCNYKPSLFLPKKLFHENFMLRINEQPIYLYTWAITNAHPMPHSSQQASRSSAEISTEILPPLWIHNLSDIASAAPKACVKIKPGTLRTWKLIMIFFNVPPYLLYLVVLYFFYFLVCHTQQDPQEPWSRICWIVAQLGHCLRASKLSGSLMPSILWSLNKRGNRITAD